MYLLWHWSFTKKIIRNIFLELLAINLADGQATGSACKTFGGVIKMWSCTCTYMCIKVMGQIIPVAYKEDDQ